ncbi:MAG: GAF domain-containing protein [Leptolinea sp.]|nr:GAF domain-containing protein [Leptolinea sp.]
MKNPIENSLLNYPDWKRFIESAETLLKKKTLQEQSTFLVEQMEELFHLKATIWFAHPLFPLPGEDIPDLVDAKAGLDTLVMDTFADHLPHFAYPNSVSPSKLDNQVDLLRAALPLICEDLFLGITLVSPIDSQTFSIQVITLITTFLSLCAMPIEIHRLGALKNWRMGQISIVNEVSDKITSITDIDQLCAQITNAIEEKLHYYYVAIYTYEYDNSLICRSSASSEFEIGKAPRVAVHINEGVIGWAAKHRQEMFLADVCQNSIFKSCDQLPDTQSEVAIPLMIGDRVLGVLDVQSDRQQTFHEMDLVVLRTMADNIAIAVESAHLFSGLKSRKDQITTVFEISHALSSILDLDTLLNAVVTTIQQRYQYLQVNIYTVHKGRGRIIFQTGTGEHSQEYRDAYLTFDIQDKQGILPWVARESRTFISNDVTHEPQYRLPKFMHSSTQSEIAIPLQAAGEVVGILDIHSDQKNAFDESDTFFFEALSAGIATSIRNATLFRAEQFRRQVAESVRDIAGILSTGSSLQELMDRILEKLHETLPCDAMSIWLTSSGEIVTNQLTLAASRGIHADQLPRLLHTDDTNSHWIWNAVHSDQPVIRNKDDARGPLGEVLNLPDNYSAIAAPLRAGGKVMGLITLVHHQPDRYGSESRLITQTFAGYAAVAILNNRLFSSVSEQAWVSAVLLKVAEANKEARSVEDLSAKTVRVITELIGCSTCAIYTHNQALNIYERQATHGFLPDSYPVKVLPEDQPAFLFSGKLHSPIAASFSHGEFQPGGKNNHPSGVILPLIIRNQNLGMLWVGNSDCREPISGDILHVLTGISDQTATAIENLQLIENQQQDAYISAALLQVAQTLGPLNDVNAIMHCVLHLLPILTGIETAAFYMQSPNFEGYLPVTASIGINNDSLRAMGTQLFAGDFPLLDLLTEHKAALLAPINYHQRTCSQWTSVKQFYRSKDAISQKPQEGGWLIGIPLMEKGEVFGSLVILEKPYSGNMLDKRLDLLAGIGRQTAAAIQNERIQNEQLENEKLQQEFHFARDIQQTFLPRQLPLVKGWDVASLWQPANQVAGDFFDFFIPHPDTFCAVIADVSDKGMPAALYMTVTRTLIRSFAQENLPPGEIFKKVNDLLLQDNPTGMFVTSTIIIGNRHSGTVQYANAGHNPPVFCGRNLDIRELPKGQTALGVIEGQNYQNHNVDIQPDSFLILYTDGVTDTLSPSGEVYSLKGLSRLISSTRLNRAANLASALENDLMQFRAGLTCVDDITALILHRL